MNECLITQYPKVEQAKKSRTKLETPIIYTYITILYTLIMYLNTYLESLVLRASLELHQFKIKTAITLCDVGELQCGGLQGVARRSR